MTKATERRTFWRAVFHSPVGLAAGGRTVSARLLDISLKGALLETDSAWKGKPGDGCRMSLELAPGSVIAMDAEVVHVEGSQLGLRCRSIDVDSITHLRRLVELNSGDATLLDREFSSLVREG